MPHGGLGGLCASRVQLPPVTKLSYRGQIQVGSLTGAVHLSNNNAGVPRPAQRERKSRVEHKGLSWLDPDSQ